MRGKNKTVRILFFVIFTGIFSFFSWHLYQKQKSNYNYLSFRLENADASIWIPDMDRLKSKISSSEELEWTDLNASIKSGLDLLLTQPEFSINELLGHSCFLSYNQKDFVFAIENIDVDAELLAVILRDEFLLSTKSTNTTLTINDITYQFERFGNYSIISSLTLGDIESPQNYRFGNADYTFFSKNDSIGVEHIISKDYHFKLWETQGKAFKGKAIAHYSFVERIPADVNEIAFYGSSRMNDDAYALFEPTPGDSLIDETYNWVGSGLIYIRKDSFELIIAPENSERDLSLILEEQTYMVSSDSQQIGFFNIGSYEVMPFKTSFSWMSTLKELNSDLNYFTQYLNYNVMSNSIPAMRWYIGQIQLGNMFLNNNELKQLYENALPEKSHQIYFSQNDEQSEYQLSSKVGLGDNTCMNTDIQITLDGFKAEGLDVIGDFIVDIVPDNILIIEDTALILINNRKQVRLYDGQGNKIWALNLSTEMNAQPQVVDLENDGINEFVIFQTNQIDVIDIHGKSISGFPKMLNGFSKGGVAVNYDLAYDYRFLVNSGTQLLSINEKGAVVDGWEFTEMLAPMKSDILYYVSKGKDIISFSDNTGMQYVLNRRGASRVEQEKNFKTKNEGKFLLGHLDNSTLHKIGYADQYIYNYYLIDGNIDSVELDDNVVPTNVSWKYNKGKPLLIIEENSRVAIFDEYGYKRDEILKPNTGNYFGGVLGTQDFRYVFVDNSQNNLYLLNSFGKMLFPVPLKGTHIYSVSNGLLYTVVNSKLIIYKIG